MNAGAVIQLSDTFLILSRPSSPLTWKIAIWLVTQTPVSLLSFSIPCSAKIGLPSVTVVNNLPANAQEARDVGLIPGSGRFPWRRKWQPTPVFLPGKFHGQRSLVGYNPRGHKEPDTTEHTHCCSFAQSGPPLCNPMDSITPLCPSSSPKVWPSSCPLHWWCHPAILSSDTLFSFWPQYFQNQELFQWVSCSNPVTKILEFQLQHQSFQLVFRIYFL